MEQRLQRLLRMNSKRGELDVISWIVMGVVGLIIVGFVVIFGFYLSTQTAASIPTSALSTADNATLTELKTQNGNNFKLANLLGLVLLLVVIIGALYFVVRMNR